jgi:Outer membrane protein
MQATMIIRKILGVSAFYMVLFMALIQQAMAQEQAKDTLKLSFGEALLQMQTGNQLIQAANQEIKEREYERKAAMGLYMPKVEIIGAYTLLNDDIGLDLKDTKKSLQSGMTDFFSAIPSSAISALPQPWPTIMAQMPTQFTNAINAIPDKYVMQEKQFGLITAGATLPIYAGGKIRTANKAAEVKVNQAKEKSDEQTASLITELTTRYFGLSLAEDVIAVRQEVLDGMNSHVRQAESLVKNGMIADAEKLHAEVYQAEAYRALQGSNRDAGVVRAALVSTLGTKGSIVTTSPLFLPTSIQDLDYFKQQALQSNSQLRQVAVNKQLADLNVKGEVANYLPTIALTGTKDLYNKDVTDLVPNWFVAVGVKYTLFDGLSRTRKVQAAKSLQRRVVDIQEKAQNDIQVLVTNLYEQLMKISEQLISIQTSLKFSEEYLRVREKSFSEGYATSLDVVDAQLNLSKVKIDRLNLIYTYDITLAQLLEASGLSQQIQTYQTNAIQEHYEKK